MGAPFDRSAEVWLIFPDPKARHRRLVLIRRLKHDEELNINCKEARRLGTITEQDGTQTYHKPTASYDVH